MIELIYITKQKFKYIASFLIIAIAILFILDNSGKLLYPLKYDEYVFKYSSRNNIDPYLVFAIMKAESSFNPDATSIKNARGLMQITDRTGSWGAEKLKIENFTIEHLYNPETNIAIGCWYLNWLMKEFNGDMDLVIAAYNGGSGKVNEWLRNKEYSYSGESLDRIPYRETDIYLKRVKNYYLSYKELYEKDV